MFTELHREEKREEGDRDGQEDKGGIKRREIDPAGKGTGQMPTKPNKRGRDRESTS